MHVCVIDRIITPLVVTVVAAVTAVGGGFVAAIGCVRIRINLLAGDPWEVLFTDPMPHVAL